jgi:hypothetical protein
MRNPGFSETLASVLSHRWVAEQRALDPLDNPGRTAFYFVLPEPNHSPSLSSEQATYLAIAGFVPPELLRPVASIRAWHAISLGAAVPVAAVEEHDQTCGFENEIRLAAKIARTELPSAKARTDHAEPDRLLS